ncbi:hypothetical protein LCGC14_1395640 [marine sediment metagenome]|uniref:Uncharacterized protein n=1 Tax=marine sediment metagenome TaxID=412755 RepID=A0A0F9N064_9ZZZZ
MTTAPCIVCKGSGIQKCRTQTMTSEGWTEEKPLELTCIWCDDGQQTVAQAQDVINYRNAWCKCPRYGFRKRNVRYIERRHAIDVMCNKCDKYLQVG